MSDCQQPQSKRQKTIHDQENILNITKITTIPKLIKTLRQHTRHYGERSIENNSYNKLSMTNDEIIMKNGISQFLTLSGYFYCQKCLAINRSGYGGGKCKICDIDLCRSCQQRCDSCENNNCANHTANCFYCGFNLCKDNSRNCFYIHDGHVCCEYCDPILTKKFM